VEKKIIGGIPNCLNYCEIFIDTEFTNVAAKYNLARFKVEIVSFCVRMCPVLSISSGNQGFSNSGCIS